MLLKNKAKGFTIVISMSLRYIHRLSLTFMGWVSHIYIDRVSLSYIRMTHLHLYGILQLPSRLSHYYIHCYLITESTGYIMHLQGITQLHLHLYLTIASTDYGR